MARESIETLCHKARQAVAQGENDQARQIYLQALSLKKDAPDVHYGLATVCFLMGDLSSAANHFKEVTRLDPLRPGAYINLGAVYNRLDQLDDAVQALRRGIQLDSHRAEGYYNLGLVYRRKGLLDLAAHAYHEATRVNPRMADAHLNLANVYLDKGQASLAAIHYRQALQVRPNWDKALGGLERADAALAAQEAAHTPSATAARINDAPAPAVEAPAPLDPDRTVDPHAHAGLLTTLHKATIDSENVGRNFLTVLEKQIEPAIKDLSSALLYPDTSMHELDQLVQKFETAVNNMRQAQRELKTSVERVRNLGEQLLKS